MERIFLNLSTLFIVSILLLNSSCEEDDKRPITQLPPATQEGLNTFGCLVNGQAWTPKGYNGTSNLDLSYDFNYRGGTFNLGAYRYNSNSSDSKQSITIYSDSLRSTGTYLLNTPDHKAAKFRDRLNSCYYDQDSSVLHEGILTITKFDLETRIISGTFEFTLTKPNCDTVRVTEGRFDMKI